MDLETVFEWLDNLDSDATLIGGQAVAVWEYLLGVPQLTETVDIDFLGGVAEAVSLANRLQVNYRIPSLDDHTPNTAILYDEDGTVLVDFVNGVVGVNETDILRRRVLMRTPNGNEFHILHPFDCVASRLSNYMLLPSKRNPKGLAQLNAAIGVCEAYGKQLLADGRESEAIKLTNRIFDLAETDLGKSAFCEHRIDLLGGIPDTSLFSTPQFVNENYSRRMDSAQQKREKHRAFLERFAPSRLQGSVEP